MTNPMISAHISIEELTLRCIVGLKAEEREHPQDVSISVTVAVDIGSVVVTDGLDGSLNYRELSKRLIAVASELRPHSLERLAFQLVQATFAIHESVQHVNLSVRKLGALRYAKSVGVSISVSRHDHEQWDVPCH